MDQYSRQLHYHNILLNAQVVDPSVRSGESPIQIPVSQVVQQVEAPCEPKLIETLVSTALALTS